MMTNIPNGPGAELEKVIRTALNKTKQGRMTWEATDAGDTFIYTGRTWSLVIAKDQWSMGPTLQLLDDAGRVVSTLDGSAGLSAHINSPDLAMAAQYLPDLYEAAKASALDVRSVVKETLQELEEL